MGQEDTGALPRTPSCCAQFCSLFCLKELRLKRTRPLTTICEFFIPALLCALLVMGVAVSDDVTKPDTSYTPTNLTAAYSTLGPTTILPLFRYDFVVNLRTQVDLDPPAGIPPLGLYLGYAYASGRLYGSRRVAPFDGSYLAVAVDDPALLPEVESLMDRVVNRSAATFQQMLNGNPVLKNVLEQEIAAFASGVNRSFSLNQLLAFPPVRARFFDSVERLDWDAVNNGAIWGAVVIESMPRNGVGEWRYRLRFNTTAIPTTKRFFDKFVDGLSTKYYAYYKSGFLSLQTALNAHIYSNQSAAAASTELLPFGIPFPIKAYTRNSFFDFAGNLIGLVVVFSFLIPLSTMVRSLVLEKETKLRENLLMMGASLPAYYCSVLMTYGLTFVIIALIAAAEIGSVAYKRSDASLYLILFILFAIASVAFSLAFIPFFRNARIAALVSPLIFFITSQLYNIFLESGELVTDGRTGGKAITSLFPTMAFYLGAAMMALTEGSGQGVTWKTAREGDFSVMSSIGFLVLDIFLWLFLAWYFDQVVPSEFGVRRNPCFLCSPSYWCGGSRNHTRDNGSTTRTAEQSTAAIEPAQRPVTDRGVKISGLRKVFGRSAAVEGLSLEMSPGQITALLGANGAGKTTTISMLTGLIPPTQGSAVIDGKSILTDMRQIRLSLGVCPQANVLFDSLTPTQHLELYASLKGYSKSAARAATARILEQFSLTERAHTASRSLSGGQKRKLCLAIALMGDAKTIFLDEPTSGMDPYSRRAIWQTLRSQRDGRTLVLTTHFLDEAEILADRIAIMAEGKLSCYGSALFLKAHFGVGYSLSLVKASNGSFESAKLVSFIQQYVAQGRLVSESRAEASVHLPTDDLAGLQRLLEALDSSLASLGVTEYGVSCTSLEDVFLQINEAALERLAAAENGRAGEVVVGTAIGGAETELNSVAKVPPAQYSAHAQHAEEGVLPARRNDVAAATRVSFAAVCCSLVTKRRLSARRDCCTTCCQLIFPMVLIMIALVILNISNRLIEKGPAMALTPEGVYLAKGWEGPKVPKPVQILLSDDPLTQSYSSQLRAQGWAPANLTNCLSEFPLSALNLTDYLFANPSTTTLAGFSVTDQAHASLLFNASAIHALPALTASLYNAQLSEVSANLTSITAFSDELPVSNDRRAKIESIVSVFSSIMILIPFGFVAASFVTPLVRERESGSKQMQFVSGVKGLAYWIASWCWDAILFLVIVVLSMIVFGVSRRSEFTGNSEATLATILTLVLFGFATLPLSSAASFLFKTPSNGLIVMMTFHFLTGFGLVITDFILSTALDGTAELSKGIKWLFRIFPAYCLGANFYSLSTRQAYVQTTQGSSSLYGFACSSNGQLCPIGGPLVYLAVEGVLFIFLTLLLQAASSRSAALAGKSPMAALLRCLHSLLHRSEKGTLPTRLNENGRTVSPGFTDSLKELEDDAVTAEREAIDAGHDDGQLVIKHLRKVYGGEQEKVAVRDLCLRVQQGECFGFLGVNGAGKSTTFSMLTGAVAPSSGDAFLNGKSILSEQDAIRKMIGYCPQQDSLEFLMTGRETLRMYAKIKGVRSHLIESEVNGLLADLDLLKFADKPAGKYSGGNKRKLCVGIALVGNPTMVLLDEPSSGMDAASKRFLWSVIKRRTANFCTLLTTHSMEECEALCNRIGVMVDGALRCLGPIQSLKTKYGQGYKLDVRLDMENSKPDELIEFLQQGCGGMAKAKERHHVLECSVSQCTLEQIFLLMAKKPNFT